MHGSHRGLSMLTHVNIRPLHDLSVNPQGVNSVGKVIDVLVEPMRLNSLNVYEDDSEDDGNTLPEKLRFLDVGVVYEDGIEKRVKDTDIVV